MKPLIVIVGPTGIGKSSLAIQLACLFDGEIVNADSRQVYRYMDIGTAKPSAGDFAKVPHHLFNIINPDEEFSLAQYQEMALKAIRKIQNRSRIPFLVGGSGQYVWAVVEGWKIPRVPPDLELRGRLEKIAQTNGSDVLFRQLEEFDPAAAQKIDKRNIRRVIRALEVSIQSGIPFSKHLTKEPPELTTNIIGLTAERKILYRRIDSRVDEMIKRGLIEEVAHLRNIGYRLDLPSMSSLGYSLIGRMLDGELSRDEAIQQLKIDNHRFVRHQYAWFKLKDERIHWFYISSYAESEIIALVANFLNSHNE